MVAKRGSELTISRGDGASPEVFTQVGDVQNATLTINGNAIEITTGDDVDGNGEIWRTYLTGPKDFSVQANGISNAFLPIQTVYDDYATGAFTNYEIAVPNVGTYTLSMIVDTMEFTGNYDGAAGFSVTLRASGAPAFVAAT